MTGLVLVAKRLVEGHYEGAGKKNLLFVECYCMMFDAVATDLGLTIPKRVRSAFLALIGLLVKLVHRWDDYLDKPRRCKLSPPEARQRVYTRRNRNRIQDLLADCGIRSWRGLDGCLDFVERYFHLECRLQLTGKPGRGMGLDRVLSWCNCDYALYNCVFEAFLKKWGCPANFLKLFRRFMLIWVVIDIICDHLADLTEDCAETSWNSISWRGGTYDWEELVTSGTIPDFVKRGIMLAGEARESLKALEPYPCTHNLLGRFLEASTAALKILERHDYLVGLPAELRQQLLDIILKPFPWSRKTKEQALEWIEVVLESALHNLEQVA